MNAIWLKLYIRLHVIYALFLSDFSEIFSTGFRKHIHKYYILCKYLNIYSWSWIILWKRTDRYKDRETDSRANMIKLLVLFYFFFNLLLRLIRILRRYAEWQTKEVRCCGETINIDCTNKWIDSCNVSDDYFLKKDCTLVNISLLSILWSLVGTAFDSWVVTLALSFVSKP
jgi:hypothetical protein